MPLQIERVEKEAGLERLASDVGNVPANRDKVGSLSRSVCGVVERAATAFFELDA